MGLIEDGDGYDAEATLFVNDDSFVVRGHDVDVLYSPIVGQDVQVLNSLAKAVKVYVIVIAKDVLKEDLGIHLLVEALLFYFYDFLDRCLLFGVGVTHVLQSLLKFTHLLDLGLLFLDDLSNRLVECTLYVVNDLLQL